MSYTRPDGDAADFILPGYTPPIGNAISARFPASTDFRFSGEAYTRPDGDGSDFDLPPGDIVAQFPPSEYTRPDGDAADFGSSTAVTPEAVIDFGVDVVFDVAAEHETEVPEAVVDFSIDVSADAAGAHGIAGTAAFSIDVSAEATGAHGVSGTASFSIDVSASAVAEHPRYELKGQVRDAGVLVNRTVRAYRRDTGALVGEQFTTLGRFRIHAGFEAREHYILPISLDSDATDWAPPVANRVMSVLAED